MRYTSIKFSFKLKNLFFSIMSFCSIFWEFDLPFLPPSDHFFKNPLTNRTKKEKKLELLLYQVEGKDKIFFTL